MTSERKVVVITEASRGIGLLHLRGDALVACGRRDETPRAYPYRVGCARILTPPETGVALAALYGATYQLEPAHGHNVLLGNGARRIAEDVIAWVVGRLGARVQTQLNHG